MKITVSYYSTVCSDILWLDYQRNELPNLPTTDVIFVSIPTSSHRCGYQNLGRHWPCKLCVQHLTRPSRGAKLWSMAPETECACAKRFGVHSPLFCTSWYLARYQEVLHTQFAWSMATKVLVATTWLLVGIVQLLHSKVQRTKKIFVHG